MEESNRLSMFHVRTLFAVGEAFYPLPYRNGDGSIMFPSHAQGCYMRDDVLAAFEWRDVLGHHGLYRDGGLIDVKEALFFEPGEPDARPFAWVRELFDYRAALVKTDANDVRAIVIKLMLNSIYGKFAQGVGNPGSPPRFASPWMAAAITAGTRRKLLRASLTAPKAIVSLMTDGIVAEKMLPIATSAPGVKELGEWEAAKVHESGGVFVQSGFYYLTKPKTRGFKAAKAGIRPSLATNVSPRSCSKTFPLAGKTGSRLMSSTIAIHRLGERRSVRRHDHRDRMLENFAPIAATRHDEPKARRACLA